MLLTVSNSRSHCQKVSLADTHEARLTFRTSDWGQTTRAVGQYFGLIFAPACLMVFFRRWKSEAVPLFLMIAESYEKHQRIQHLERTLTKAMT